MNQITSTEQSDSKFFSQRAKDISLLKDRQSSSSSETYFQFSNRKFVPLVPVGRGHGNTITNNHHQNICTGRGRTTIPLSPFILQKDNLLPSTTDNFIVMHDEVQFVRPYFGPPTNTNDRQSTSISRKREVLLSALKEIESGLKTL